MPYAVQRAIASALGAHALLLDAYEPDEPGKFRQRLLGHQVIQCVETIQVYAEHEFAFDLDARRRGIQTEAGRLAGLLERR